MKVTYDALSGKVAVVERSAVEHDGDEVFQVNLSGSREAVRELMAAAKQHGYEAPAAFAKWGL
jgi:hypothetical protein